jgi:hypothetical protein
MSASRTIQISERTFHLLDQEAKRSRLPPNVLAERLLEERLSSEQQVWREEFESLLASVHERMAQYDAVEVESDIAAASSEARTERRARRCAD